MDDVYKARQRINHAFADLKKLMAEKGEMQEYFVRLYIAADELKSAAGLIYDELLTMSIAVGVRERRSAHLSEPKEIETDD